MGSSISTAMGLCSWPRIREWTLKKSALTFQNARRLRRSGAFLETDTVFGDVLDTGGNIVCGESSDWGWATESASRTTLLRGLLRGPGVDVFVGPEKAQYSVPRNLLLHYSKMAHSIFVQRRGDVDGGVEHSGGTHFKEVDENALYLPEHAPETFEFVLKWIYERKLGIAEYCHVIFGTHYKTKEGLEAAILLLCRVYSLADYLIIEDIIDTVMDEIYFVMVSGRNEEFSPIGPDVVSTVFRNTPQGSRLQIYILDNLADSLLQHGGGRSVEEYTRCFDELEGFGGVFMKHVVELYDRGRGHFW